jgi:DNA-binding response OmpR family regulator
MLHAGTTGRTILLIEAEPDLRDLLTTVLTVEGYTVLPTATVLAALTMDQHDVVDLVLYDALPDPEQISLLLQSPARGSDRAIPIVILGDEERLCVGMPDVVTYLPHPFRMHQLLATVSAALLSRALPLAPVAAGMQLAPACLSAGWSL